MEARKYDVPEMERMMTDPDYAATSDVDRYRNFVPDVHFELIPIKNLVSNQQYQRKLSMRHVESAAAEFNIFEINPVKVSRRDGINYVFDGQHTAEIVAKESGSRDTPVWCMVYDGLDYKLEAYVFANQKKFAKTLTPYEIFMANVEAEEETELTIKALVESYSLTITNKSNTTGGLCAISALEYIFRKYGYHILDQTLYIAVSTWEGDPVSLCATILKGIARLLDTYGDGLRADLFVERLSRVPVKEIIRSARERNNGSLGYAEALLTFYNKRTRYPLRWSKLYKNSSDSDADEEEESEQPEEADDSASVESVAEEMTLLPPD